MFSPHSSFQKVIRGGQVTLHIFTMYGQILKVMMAFVFAILIAFNGFWFMTKNTAEQREIFNEYISATLRVQINKYATQALKDPNGHQYYVRSSDFIRAAPVRRIVDDICVNLIQGASISALLAVSFFIGLSIWFKGMGSRATQTKVLNNHILETPKNVNKLLSTRKQKSELKIAENKMRAAAIQNGSPPAPAGIGSKASARLLKSAESRVSLHTFQEGVRTSNGFKMIPLSGR